MAPLYRCAACRAEGGELPFRCPSAGADGLDHVLRRDDPSSWGNAHVPHRDEPSLWGKAPALPNPFERYRERLSFWALGRSRGLDDESLVSMVRALDCRVGEVDGRAFVATPFTLHPALSRAAAGAQSGPRVWVKDETGNVSGSHKARHLMGVMLYLQVAERVGLIAGRPPLAIASCGNAALAAAVVARAAAWPLRVFVPPSAHPAVLERLHRLAADIVTCRRAEGVSGDPCYHAFRAALAEGAVPFCCQGSDNAVTIEGGATLAWEMLDAGVSLDAVFVQVGGGALAAGVVEGFDVARQVGAIARMPRICTVQTAGGYPLARAYDRLVARLVSDWPGPGEPPSDSPALLAEAIAARPEMVDDAMRYARSHRAEFMWPWEHEPRSVAHGILDDETYDWAAVVEGMLRSGGWPLVVGEERLEQANATARAVTGSDVDHTGSAGLAGLMEALPRDESLSEARVAVIFSGVRR